MNPQVHPLLYCSLLTPLHHTLLYCTILLCYVLCLMPFYLVCYTIAGPPVKYIFRNSAIAPHDFSFTDNYYVFVENRAEGDTLPYLLGNFIALHYAIELCAALYRTTPHTQHHTALHYTELNCASLHSTAPYNLTHCVKQS